MAHKKGICKVSMCERPDMGNGYCRLHYITFWRQIKARQNLFGVVLRNRVREALVRDDLEGNCRKHLEIIKGQERLSDGDLEEIVSEIRHDQKTHR